MTTSINNQGNQTPNVNPGSSDAGGNGLMKISAGPAALAQLLIYQIMALYGKIVEMDQQQKINMTKAQSTAAQTNAAATIASGNDMMIQYATMGALSIASAVGSMGVQKYMENNTTGKALAKEQNTASTELKSLQGAKTALNANPPAAAQDGPDEGQGAGDRDLKAEFASGNFKKAGDNEATQQAMRQVKTEKEANGTLAEWKAALNSDLDRSTQNYNSAVHSMNSRQQTITLYKDVISQAVGVGNNAVQSAQAAAKAGHDASAALSQTTTQMAGGTAGDFGQAANKAFEAQNAEIQVLENINRSNSVNG